MPLSPANALNAQLATMRAEQIVQQTLKLIDGHGDEPLLASLVAGRLLRTSVTGVAAVRGSDAAFRMLLAFSMDITQWALTNLKRSEVPQ